jgi:hypothetical protein
LMEREDAKGRRVRRLSAFPLGSPLGHGRGWLLAFNQAANLLITKL